MFNWYKFVTGYPKYTSIQKDTTIMERTAERQFNTGTPECMGHLLPLRDAMDILNGKWKIIILLSLTFGPKRFKVMQREIHGITAKMLSKELKELEANELIKRTVYDTTPVTVEYALTEYGWTLEKVINEIRLWGVEHRKRMMTGHRQEQQVAEVQEAVAA